MTAATNIDVHIAQDFQYEGDDWWSWRIWIEGSAADLDQIEQVTYQLHPTFPEPVRTIRTRATKFALKSAGWGVFPIYARVVTKEGAACKLKHELELLYEDGTRNEN